MTAANWSAGYITDTSYTFGYYSELNPLRVKLALLLAGYGWRAPVHACDLGYGQGVSVAMHAAASNVAWAGTDFNSGQALHARQLVDAANVDADLSDQSFAEFCQRSDLPDFDFIALHGIWTWISGENRTILTEFFRRKLKVGGVVYLGYNAQPGWAAAAPLRHLMSEIGANLIPASGGSEGRVAGAMKIIDDIMSTSPQYLLANPGIKERFDGLKGQNQAYLAHEYFNMHWEPMHFADMARWLEPAKLTFAASVNLLDHVEAINLSSEQQQLISSIPSRIMRETVRDYCVNQQFRRDLWVRGTVKLTEFEQAEALRAERFIMITPRDKAAMTVNGRKGTANLAEAVYGPLLDIMGDHKVRSLADLEAAMKGRVNFAQLVQAIMILTGMSTLAPAQDSSTVAKVKKRTDRLNQYLMEKARAEEQIIFLSSPVTGGGVPLSRFNQLFCLALRLGKKTPSDWAEFVFQLLRSQNQKIVKDGAAIEDDNETRAALLAQAQEFSSSKLPILKALEIV